MSFWFSQLNEIGQITNSDFNAFLGIGEQSNDLITHFLNDGSESVVKMLAIPDSKSNDAMSKIYNQFVNYAKNSKQDFRKFNNFIDLKLRPIALKIISFIILDSPTYFGVFLDRIADLWSYSSAKSKKED